VNSGGSWPERYQVVNARAQTYLALATCNVTGGVTAANGTRPTCANPHPKGNNGGNPITGYTYVYNREPSQKSTSSERFSVFAVV
jgi:hypothetical protein